MALERGEVGNEVVEPGVPAEKILEADDSADGGDGGSADEHEPAGGFRDVDAQAVAAEHEADGRDVLHDGEAELELREENAVKVPAHEDAQAEANREDSAACNDDR